MKSLVSGPTVDVARGLLGALLEHDSPQGRTVGRVVETEAYLARGDGASHSHRGPTERNASMFLAAGHAYVYRIYGMHHCFNVVAGRVDEPVAVLIRALEPTEGESLIRLNRARGDERRADAFRTTDLCSGPGKICQALRIDCSMNGADLAQNPSLFILRTKPRRVADTRLTNTARVGVGSAGRWGSRRLRWYLTASPHVSAR